MVIVGPVVKMGHNINEESLSKELRIDPFGNCVTRIRMESVRYSENHSNYYQLKEGIYDEPKRCGLVFAGRRRSN